MVDFATSKEHFTAFFDCLRNSRTAVFVGSFRSPFAEGEAAAHAADGTKKPIFSKPKKPPESGGKDEHHRWGDDHFLDEHYFRRRRFHRRRLLFFLGRGGGGRRRRRENEEQNVDLLLSDVDDEFDL
jgi:hypothetical protein